MKIEVGKPYKTRGGWKAIVEEDDKTTQPYYVSHLKESIHNMWHMPDGRVNVRDLPEYDLIAEWEEPMEYKMWKDMTPEEKGALLLADHECKSIEFSTNATTWSKVNPTWVNNFYYRVKPEPVVKTVEMFGNNFTRYSQTTYFKFCENGHIGEDKYKITFNLVDGEPDWNSLKGETL